MGDATDARPLRGKTAVVTGASAGIGRATARRLARDGAAVVAAARSGSELEDLAATIENELGADALAVPTDVTDETQVRQLVERAVDAFGGLDVVVSNAGIGRPGDVESMTTADYRAMMAVNVDGAFFVARAALPHLRDSAGTLVFVGSYAGKHPFPKNPVYGATNWWVRGFAASLAGQVGTDGVAVTTVNPAEVRTDFGGSYRDETNRERYDPTQATEPEEVAAAIAFAARQERPSAIVELDIYRRDKYRDF